MSRAVALIPARLESSRLPRKPLVDIHGLPMIVHVLERCRLAKSVSEVVVATDSPEVRDAVEARGGKVAMTRSDHQTGSDRIAEVAAGLDCDIVVNIQGDEALVRPEHVDAAVRGLEGDPNADIALLVNPFSKYGSPSDIKVVVDERGYVMYLSRADIPSGARTPNPPMLKAYHVVPFRRRFLLEYAAWPKGRLETIEFNEYLRILEKGRRIRAVPVESSAVSVDTPADLEWVRSEMAEDALFKDYR